MIACYREAHLARRPLRTLHLLFVDNWSFRKPRDAIGRMGTASRALWAFACLLVLSPFKFLQTEAFCGKYVETEGYSCHEHKLYTEDGFGILLHRVGTTSTKVPLSRSISASTNRPFVDFPESPGFGGSQSSTPPADVSASTSGPAFGEYPNQLVNCQGGDPVLLLHPEMLNGDSWFKHADPENQTARLPLLLADQGFDVWIGHQRATHWSHDHLIVTHQDPEYWNWTGDQLAQHDVPTMLRFVRAETSAKVHVVGFSQGATVGAAAATRAKIAEHMKSLTLIGPTMYRGLRNPLLTGPWAGLIRDLLHEITEQIAASPGWVNFTRDVRELSNFKPTLTLTGPRAELRYSVSGPDCCLSPSLSLLDNGWDGTTSSNNIEHFHQALMTPNWRKFDHGTEKLNFAAYGRPTPPDYEPHYIPAHLPVLVIYGGNDVYSPSEGVMEFIASLQSRPSVMHLPGYAHLDLFFSTRRKQDVYDPISMFLRCKGTA